MVARARDALPDEPRRVGVNGWSAAYPGRANATTGTSRADSNIMRCARVSRKASFGRISGSSLWVIVCDPTAKPQPRILRAHVLQNFSSAFVSMNVAFMSAFLNTSAILEWA